MDIRPTSLFSRCLRRRVFYALLVLGVLLSCAPGAAAELKRGQKSFGPRVGYVGGNRSIMGGLEFQVATGRHVRLAPDVAIVFRHHDRDGLGLGLNVHFPFEVAPRLVLYPLVGVQYMSWGIHGLDPASEKDVTTHTNRFGANFGGGIDFICQPRLKLSVQGRYSLMESYSTAIVSAGISYIF